MKELNKDHKITDKAFTRLIAMSVLAMLICIAALSSSTWALFSEVKPSADNAIKAADNCFLEVSVLGDPGNVVVGTMDVDHPKTLSLASGVYTVKLSLPAESSSGYLNLSYGQGLEYNTEYILRHKDSVAHTLTFTLTVNAPIDVTFTPRWGTHSFTGAIADGGSITIG